MQIDALPIKELVNIKIKAIYDKEIQESIGKIYNAQTQINYIRGLINEYDSKRKLSMIDEMLGGENNDQ